ncbi:MAG: hypothetical protein Q9225_005078 [Loekoesia sp. 1 TL-2023]
MLKSINPFLTQPDLIILNNLSGDIQNANESQSLIYPEGTKKHLPDDQKTVQLLNSLNDKTNEAFQPTVFTGWDQKDIPAPINKFFVQPYTRWAKHIVRRPTDVVFLTHILLYLATSVPSALYLYYNFSWPHAIFHWVMQGWYCGSFTLMLHNHIHNNGVLTSKNAWFDKTWPYILEPLMGHTWDSYYYHHVKHHHVENNGPGDLSSTIRYQRDELLHFLHYVGRFVALIWIELPIYFWRKNKRSLALRTLGSELSSYAFIVLLARWNLRATIFVLIVPLVQMRIGMMVGNWGQHALVDEVEPDSDFRSSVTLIDVPVSTPQDGSPPGLKLFHLLSLNVRMRRLVGSLSRSPTVIVSMTAIIRRIISTLADTGEIIPSLSPKTNIDTCLAALLFFTISTIS